jgi:hypothetical protein
MLYFLCVVRVTFFLVNAARQVQTCIYIRLRPLPTSWAPAVGGVFAPSALLSYVSSYVSIYLIQ